MTATFESSLNNWKWILKEIDQAKGRGKVVYESELVHLGTIRKRLEADVALTDNQHEFLWRVYRRMTEPKRLPR